MTDARILRRALRPLAALALAAATGAAGAAEGPVSREEFQQLQQQKQQMLIDALTHKVTGLETEKTAATPEAAGTYKLKAWHERMPAKVREITVPATGEIRADFTLGITGLPKN